MVAGWSGDGKWMDALDIVKRDMPKWGGGREISFEGTLGTMPIKIDAEAAENVFGMKFLGFEEQVVSVAEYYLSLKT